jgi:hypothetical protein
MVEPTSFFSKCPTCGHPRLQSGYAQGALVHLLDTGQPINAYCVICDRQWPITIQERYAVVRGIAAMDQHAPPSSSDNRPPQRPRDKGH